jgi:hypothetical protein
MTTVATSIPDDLRLNFHQGEEIRGTPRTLSEWEHKWAGTLQLAENESPQSLRETYLTEKFGDKFQFH